jgi:hypothetical protein
LGRVDGSDPVRIEKGFRILFNLFPICIERNLIR